MSHVLAALDTGAAARPVLETALSIGRLFGADVEAVHVHDGSDETPSVLASRNEVRLQILAGPAEAALLGAISAPDVVVAVMGARRTPSGRRPTGHIALQVLERANKPIVIVPPESAGLSPRVIRRLLLPLEGTEESSRPVLDCLRPLLATDVELTVVHVFTSHTLPRVLDHPARDLELLGGEFLARHCPDAADIVLEIGPVGPRVADLCTATKTDLVVLSWSQDSSPGHADVVRDVLGRSQVPVLLLPISPASTCQSDDRDRTGNEPN